MKALGSKSISSILKKAITVVWYLEFLLLLTPPLVFLDDDGITYKWPVTLNTPTVATTITAKNSKITNFKLHDRYQVKNEARERILSFEDSSTGRRLLQTLHNLVTIALIMFVTWQIKKVFGVFAEDKPFDNNNASRIRWIALSVLFWVFYGAIESALYRLYTVSTITLSGATFDYYNDGFDFKTFLLGLLLLIIAEAFRRATEYKTDSESIL